MATSRSARRWPARGGAGLLLIGVFWSLNWSLPGLRTHWAFFPMWLGYCLVADAWTWRRSGTSFWSRSRLGYSGLFLASVPVWWIFELINERTRNWHYLGRSEFGDLEYFLLASVSFSIVLPAVLGTAEWVSTFERAGSRRDRRPLGLGDIRWYSPIGGLCLFLCLAWPGYFFPLVWISLFLILDPINDRRGRRSILRSIASGDWGPARHMALGSLICGFFWEMWNFYSYPKWVYTIPFVDFLRVFEMPLLGYGGYIPFGLELFAVYHLIGRREDVFGRRPPSSTDQ